MTEQTPNKALIQTMTWQRDSHGLFDYESKNFTSSNFIVNNSKNIYRTGNEIQISSLDQTILPQDKLLLSIQRLDDQSFTISQSSPSEPLWMVVRQPQSNSCVLKEQSILKLGRVRYRVNEICCQISDELPCKSHSTDSESESSNQDTLDDITPCRVCYGDTSDKQDPLISPCHCTGSLSNIHVSCLQQWIRSRVITQQNVYSMSYYYSTIECEICKFPLPQELLYNEKQFKLLDIQKPEVPYIILEALATDSRNRKGFHVISMAEKNSIRLGRGHDSDVRIQDISVSRSHAIIKFQGGNFVIEDNTSKFGTLVQVEKEIQLHPKQVLKFQMGRTVINVACGEHPEEMFEFMENN